MKKQVLKAKIEEAERQIALAEEEISGAIRELDVVPRAEKTITPRTIESALDRLRASRAKVSELKMLLDEEGET
jgi:hypothetical protein